MKQSLGYLAVLVLVLWALCVFAAERKAPAGPLPVIIGDTLFELDLALTPRQRERGLMFREHLEPEQGMLFVFPDTAQRAFWMKNTLVDLDIVYLDSKARVVSFTTMTAEQPRSPHETEAQYEDRLPRYPSDKPAQFAIEFRAGTLSMLNLEKGQRIAIDPDALLPHAKKTNRESRE